MCEKNTTNLEDGSSSCPVAFIAGSSPSYRYAVVVSFGVLLNGTALDDIASKVFKTFLTPGLFAHVHHATAVHALAAWP